MKQLISFLLLFAMGATPVAHTDQTTLKTTEAAYIQTVDSIETASTSTSTEVVDWTDKLNDLMRENEEILQNYMDEHGYFAATLYYYVKVTDGGEWDIKRTDEWKQEEGVTYLYQGKELRMDDAGNIHFGYLGAMLFSEEFVCFGAGMNNFLKFGTVDGDLSSYYDDPHDQEMMRLGYQMYVNRTLYQD